MNCRDAAQALAQIAVLLELHDGDRDVVRGMQGAARTVGGHGERDVREVVAGMADEIVALNGEALDVLRDLAESNGSAMLERLQEETPEGLMEMLRVPGLGPARIRSIHEHLHVDTLLELELAARDGRLAALPKFGAKTADKVLKGIADLRATGAYVLWQHGRAEAERIAEAMRAHPDVLTLEIAGSIRRRAEIVRDVDLVAAVRGSPSVVAASLAQRGDVREVLGGGGRSLSLRLADGVRVDLACVRPEQLAMALWRATGSALHVQQVTMHAARLGFTMANDELRDASGTPIPIASEMALYEQLGLAWVPPEQREGHGEVDAAARGTLPVGVREEDLRGALHCHSQYSDGGATVEQMARAAMARGLRYLGVSDHSQSNTYAGGLSRDRIVEQHAEIDALNARFAEEGVDFRVLKGIEADILPCGRVDYDAAFLDRFDFVIGSVHTRYGMNAEQMTNRVLKALDDPHLTILGHPTGRLLLTREPYAIDLAAIIEKAGRVGVAIELNADPHRLDIDWKACRMAAETGTMVSIGPDAHSPQGFDNLALGTAIARKGWLEPRHVLNTRSAEEVLAFARARRVAAGSGV
ncbi:MAG: PHP domain-containing protein [Gemmatimonas sp.]